MEDYANALLYAIPGFVVLILIEAVIAWWRGMDVQNSMDTISSLSSGLTNTLVAMLGWSVVIVSYDFMVTHFAVFTIKSTALLFVLAFVGHDFAQYWSHRFSHEINVFWNRHIVHHSSEEFNLSCALRQEISAIFGIFFFLHIPMAILGLPTVIVATVAAIHLFAQFWYHTRLINKMGFLEHLIVTPSHHRVHHAINDEYLDKNFAPIFIIWDKIFGTFQAELDDVPPVYGVKKPVNTWNPILINWMHFWALVKDAFRTRKLWDKVRIWFMPTGWRPADVRKKYPIEITTNPYTRPKYQPETSTALKAWSWAQLVIANLMVYHLIAVIASFGVIDVVLYVTFLMVMVFAYTTLMDRHRLAIPAELVKFAFGAFILYQTGGWFGLDEYFANGTYIVAIYMLVSVLAAVYFGAFEKNKAYVTQTASH